MKKLLIFVLFLTGCAEHEIKISECRYLMTISDAIPIQFWIDGVETYNQKEVCGINKFCFCLPWNCDQELPLQVKDTIQGQEINLIIYDSYDNTLDTIPFESQEIFVDQEIDLQFSNTDFPTSITGWENFNGSDRSSATNYRAFAFSSGNATTGPSTANIGSKYFATLRPDNHSLGWPPGNYVVTVRGSAFSDGSTTAIAVYGMMNSSSQTTIAGQSVSGAFPTDDSTVTRTITFTLTQYYTYLAFAFTSDGTDFTGTIREILISSAPTTETSYSNTIYSLTLIPSELDICNEQVNFQIVGDEETWNSDCLDVRESHDCTTLIRYTNSKNFADINYTTASPSPEFFILVPAIFFHEENPQELEQMETSSQTIVRLRNEIKVKRRLELGYMPDYMHRKMLLILSHDTIEIDGDTWVMGDPYEKVPPSNKRFPLKMASVLLTLQGYIKRNIL